MTISWMKPPQSQSFSLQLTTGDRGIISHIDADRNTLHAFKQMGINRGTAIAVRQRSPTSIVKIGDRLLALGDRARRGIYVRFS